MSVPNYFEYIVVKAAGGVGDDDAVKAVSYDLSDSEIETLIQKLLVRNMKCYERKIKLYERDGLCYEVVMDQNDAIDDIRSYTKQAANWELKAGGRIIKVDYKKDKKPIHAFSSSRDMNNVCYIRRVTFRISNRIFVNFEKAKCMEGDYNKAYVNVNMDKNVDDDFVNSQLQGILDIIGATA